MQTTTLTPFASCADFGHEHNRHHHHCYGGATPDDGLVGAWAYSKRGCIDRG